MHEKVPPEFRTGIRSQGDLLDNRYRLVEKVGLGGYGVVFRAWDETLHRDVAIKLLHPTYSNLDRYRRRMIQEARAASQIIHEHVVRVIDVVSSPNDNIYLVMEWVEGGHVGSWLRSRQSHHVKEIAGIVRQAAEGLKAAHALRIIHRDIKCSNLLIDGTGRVKVADFGLAREIVTDDENLSLTDDFAGTIPYMSPEQLTTGAAVDTRADIYGLGVVLFELLTETRPFRGTAPAMIEQILNADAPSVRSLNPACPLDLATITEKCLRKSPDQRYASAAELSDDLGRWLEGRPILARPLNRFHRAWRLAKRYPTIASLATLVAMTAVITTTLAYGLFRETRRLDSALQVAYELLRGIQDGRLASVDDAFSEIMQGTKPIDDNDREALHHLFSAILQLQTASQREGRSTAQANGLAGMINILGSIRSLNEIRMALDSLNQAIELSETIGLAWLLRAQIRQEIFSEDPQSVLGDWLNAIRGLPTCSAAASGHGWCLKRLGRIDEATSEFERALAIDPLNEFARRGMGMIFFEADRFDQAAAQLEAAVTQTPRYNLSPHWIADQTEILALCYWKDAYLLNKNGEYAKAAKHWLKALRWSLIEDRKILWGDLLKIVKRLSIEERLATIDQLANLTCDPTTESFFFARDLFRALIASQDIGSEERSRPVSTDNDQAGDSLNDAWDDLAARLDADSGQAAEINAEALQIIREYVSNVSPSSECERLLTKLAAHVSKSAR